VDTAVSCARLDDAEVDVIVQQVADTAYPIGKTPKRR
jgi:hypothetical protein